MNSLPQSAPEKTITVSVRSVYGNETIYPICDGAKLFAQIAETKILTRRAVQSIKALGYVVVVQQPEVSL